MATFAHKAAIVNFVVVNTVFVWTLRVEYAY
jgi:hypothetical protein